MDGDENPIQPQMEPDPQEHGWVPPPGYFDPYFQNMQNTWNTSIAQFGESIQQQMLHGFHTMGQQWQSHMDTSFE